MKLQHTFFSLYNINFKIKFVIFSKKFFDIEVIIISSEKEQVDALTGKECF